MLVSWGNEGCFKRILDIANLDSKSFKFQIATSSAVRRALQGSSSRKLLEKFKIFSWSGISQRTDFKVRFPEMVGRKLLGYFLKLHRQRPRLNWVFGLIVTLIIDRILRWIAQAYWVSQFEVWICGHLARCQMKTKECKTSWFKTLESYQWG